MEPTPRRRPHPPLRGGRPGQRARTPRPSGLRRRLRLQRRGRARRPPRAARERVRTQAEPSEARVRSARSRRPACGMPSATHGRRRRERLDVGGAPRDPGTDRGAPEGAAHVPAPRRAAPWRDRPRRLRLPGGRGGLRGLLGPPRRRVPDLVSKADEAPRVEPAPLHAGSRTASSTWPTTASTGTSRRAAATRSPTTGSARRPGRAATSRTPSSCATSRGSRTACASSASSAATGSASTWAWCRSCRSRCSRAPGSARPTWSSSAASPPSRSRSGCGTPGRRC